MRTMQDTAMQFFDACETGQGWGECAQYCHADGTFSGQADVLAGVSTLEQYTEWMKGMSTPVPDGAYEIKSFAVDKPRNHVAVFGIFSGTHSGEGGPVPATGKSFSAEFVYVMEFDGDKIRHMTKIWNDGHSMKQLGWA